MSKVLPFVKHNGKKEGENMYIGDVLKQRIDALGLNLDILSENTFIDESFLSKILCNEIKICDIENVDLDIISQALYCTPEYFYSEEARKKDIVNAALNRGFSDVRSNMVKAKLQSFADDFFYLGELFNHNEGGI